MSFCGDSVMRITFDPSTLKQTRWYQLLIRFVLGGFITAATGIIGKEFGPAVGGLFLAFPAIFPASSTLIEKHEKEKKERAGLRGDKRARQLVSVDAAGTAIGCVGLFAFALVVDLAIRHTAAWLAISAATLAWAAVSVFFWQLRKRI
jgi:Protein of unknown function (DUF3147)